MARARFAELLWHGRCKFGNKSFTNLKQIRRAKVRKRLIASESYGLRPHARFASWRGTKPSRQQVIARRHDEANRRLATPNLHFNVVNLDDKFTTMVKSGKSTRHAMSLRGGTTKQSIPIVSLHVSRVSIVLSLIKMQAICGENYWFASLCSR